MFRFFQTFFGTQPATSPSPYPDQLVVKATEHAIDAVDQRLRTVRAYRQRMRPAVLEAIAHAEKLVAGLPEPVELSRENYLKDPRLGVFFASIDHMRQVLRNDRALTELLSGPIGRRAHEVHALLIARRNERNVLGMELSGDTVRREVAQVAVSFEKPALIDPAENDEIATRALRLRAFNHLVGIALERVVEAREKRSDLKRERNLLRKKLDALDAGHWRFDGKAAAAGGIAGLEKQVADIENELQSIGCDDGVLEANLDLLIDVFRRAPEQSWAESIQLCVDSMGIKRPAGSPHAVELEIQELHGIRGRRLVPLRVVIPRREFPQRRDFLAEAERLLI